MNNRFEFVILKESPILVQTGTIALNGSKTPGDGQIQLKVWVPLS